MKQILGIIFGRRTARRTVFTANKNSSSNDADSYVYFTRFESLLVVVF